MTNPTRKDFLLIGSFGLTCALGIPPLSWTYRMQQPEKNTSISIMKSSPLTTCEK